MMHEIVHDEELDRKYGTIVDTKIVQSVFALPADWIDMIFEVKKFLIYFMHV